MFNLNEESINLINIVISCLACISLACLMYSFFQEAAKAQKEMNTLRQTMSETGTILDRIIAAQNTEAGVLA